MESVAFREAGTRRGWATVHRQVGRLTHQPRLISCLISPLRNWHCPQGGALFRPKSPVYAKEPRWRRRQARPGMAEAHEEGRMAFLPKLLCPFLCQILSRAHLWPLGDQTENYMEWERKSDLQEQDHCTLLKVMKDFMEFLFMWVTSIHIHYIRN